MTSTRIANRSYGLLAVTILEALLTACGAVNADGHDAGTAPDAVRVIDASPLDAATCAQSPVSLAARWRANDNADDDTGVHDGVASGSVGYTPGAHGSAFLLDGNDLVLGADTESLWPLGSFTLEVWTRASSDGAIASKYDCGGTCGVNGNAYWGLAITQGHPSFHIRTDESDMSVALTATLSDVADDAWHHLVAVRDVDAARLALYVDGTLAASMPANAALLSQLSSRDGENDPIVIGAVANAGTTGYGGYFPGAIDELAFYQDALSDQQVSAIHAAPEGVCP